MIQEAIHLILVIYAYINIVGVFIRVVHPELFLIIMNKAVDYADNTFHDKGKIAGLSFVVAVLPAILLPAIVELVLFMVELINNKK